MFLINNITNKNLRNYIKKRIKQPTVILCFKVLLQKVITEGTEATMTKPEISAEFNEQCGHWGISTFRTDYVLRQSGNNPHVPLDTDDNVNFFIKPRFLVGMNPADYIKVIEFVDNFWEEIFKEKQRLLSEIKEKMQDTANTVVKQEFILEMLEKRETSKKGQCFEVASFSILKIYLQNLGFVLNRFSTTYSNDGGIDFTAQTAIYQVTTKLTEQKLEEDLNKAPLKKRIFVYRDSNLKSSYFDNDLILDYISTLDLKNFLEYLIIKSPQKNLDAVLDAMLAEFQREYYQAD